MLCAMYMDSSLIITKVCLHGCPHCSSVSHCRQMLCGLIRLCLVMLLPLTFSSLPLHKTPAPGSLLHRSYLRTSHLLITSISMSTPLVLITGASGHLGFRTLVLALETGYRVVATIRKEEQAKKLSSKPSVLPYQDKLTFAVVKDITAPGAFEEAMQGVTYVIHIASPIASPAPNADEGDQVSRTCVIQKTNRANESFCRPCPNASTIRRRRER